MSQKLYLNKYLKVDNIEYYTLPTLKILLDKYQESLENSEGVDPDFPDFNFNGGKKQNNINVSGKQLLDAKSKKIMNKIWQK